MTQKKNAPAVTPERTHRKAPAQCSSDGTLTQRFNHKLKGSGITDANAKKLHYKVCKKAPEVLKERAAGFLIPYFDIGGKQTDFYRYRLLAAPSGFAGLTRKPPKYLQPPGTAPELYLPPLLDWRKVAADPAQPLVITEGELKAACGTARTKYPTIGLGGVWSFRVGRLGQSWLPQFNAFQWKGRRVFIAYDSDAATNEKVIHAENALAAVLLQLDAVPHVVRIPPSGEAKVGLDDYVTARSAKAWEQLVEQAVPWRSDAATTPPPRYKLLDRADLLARPPLAWRVKGVLPARGIAQVYGPPGSGKTFLAFDMAAAIASGKEWFGYRVHAAPVVYLFLEGEAGATQRAKAWEKNRNAKLPDALRVVLQPFHIYDAAHVHALADALPPECVLFIDTQNRAAPGVDENANNDMSRILEGAKFLADATGGIAVLIAHTGKDADRGVRGHSSQAAAMDAAIVVKRDADRREWRVAKLKDGHDGQAHGFKLEAVELGKDTDGDVITSCVVDPRAAPLPQRHAQGMDAGLAVETYKQAGSAGAGVVQSGEFAGVPLDAWRDAFCRSKEGDTGAQRKAFSRARNALRKEGWLHVHDNICRVTEPTVLPLELEFVAKATGTTVPRSKVAKTVKVTRK